MNHRLRAIKSCAISCRRCIPQKYPASFQTNVRTNKNYNHERWIMIRKNERTNERPVDDKSRKIRRDGFRLANDRN